MYTYLIDDCQIDKHAHLCWRHRQKKAVDMETHQNVWPRYRHFLTRWHKVYTVLTIVADPDTFHSLSFSRTRSYMIPWNGPSPIKDHTPTSYRYIYEIHLHLLGASTTSKCFIATDKVQLHQQGTATSGRYSYICVHLQGTTTPALSSQGLLPLLTVIALIAMPPPPWGAGHI
jgi:hypothetical protein